MAQNTSPIFVLTPDIGSVRLAASSSARDGSVQSVSGLFLAGPSGSRIESVTFTSATTGSTTVNSAMVGRLYYAPVAGAAQSNLRLLQEVAIAAVTPSVSAIGATQTMFFPGGLILPAGSALSCSISAYAGNQDTTDVIARGGDY
jgi:hypothetical protein